MFVCKPLHLLNTIILYKTNGNATISIEVHNNNICICIYNKLFRGKIIVYIRNITQKPTTDLI